MAVKNPAPSHHQVLTFLSPDIRDILFYELKDSRLPQHAQGQPAYGDKHFDKAKWPDHELVYITPDEEEGMERWYYAVVPEEQDEHNFTQTFPFGGLPWASQITRAYFLKREGYTALSKGLPDSLYERAYLTEEVQQKVGIEQLDSLYVLVIRTFTEVPNFDEQSTYNAEITFPYNGSEKFPRYTRRYVVLRNEYAAFDPATANDPEHQEAILVSDKVDRFVPDPMDSVYILQTLVFDVVPEADDLLEGGDTTAFGFSISYPYGEDEFPRVTWRYRIELANYAPADGKTACPITGFTANVLVDQEMKGSEVDVQMANVVRIYDLLPGPERDSEENKAPFRSVPVEFVRTHVDKVTRQVVEAGTAPDDLAPHPDGIVQGDIPTDGDGALLTAKVVENESKIIASRELLRSTITFGPTVGTVMEPYTGKTLDFTRTLVPYGTLGTPVDNDGNFTEVRPFNQVWSVQTNRLTTDLAANSRTYTTWMHGVYWPPVLLSAPVFSAVNFENGATHHYVIDFELKAGYGGPTKAVITESWSKDPPTLATPVSLQPQAIHYTGLLVNLRIPGSLHPIVTISETTGTDHPTLEFAIRNKSFASTNFIDWPTSYLYRETVRPYVGGYLKTSIVVHSPV